MYYISVMSRQTKSNSSLPEEVRAALARLGENLKTARKRRRISETRMADLTLVSRDTLRRLEAGSEGVSLGVLANALWVLGLDPDLVKMADPAQDLHGQSLEKMRLPQRIREKKRGDLDF